MQFLQDFNHFLVLKILSTVHFRYMQQLTDEESQLVRSKRFSSTPVTKLHIFDNGHDDLKHMKFYKWDDVGLES